MNKKRLASIDVFRAVVMFFMVFVNDFWTDKEVPLWLEHAPATADTMGFSDVIFPAFLFIVGLSIPLSQSSRLESGQSQGLIFWHIIIRSFALIIMGLFHVNMENYSQQALLPKPIWVILVTSAFFLIWLDYPKEKRRTHSLLQILGVIILVLAAALYKGDSENGTVWMSTQWWGILGLIGWAYFSCATIFLLVKERITPILLCFLFFLFINVSAKLNWPALMIPFHELPIKPGGGDASNASMIMMGVLISVLYRKLLAKPQVLAAISISIATALFVFGFATRQIWGISKIQSTPSWTTISMAISILCFLLFIFLIDKKGKAAWFRPLKPAGTSTLTCYLLPYFYYAVFISLIGIHLPMFIRTGIAGIVKSLLFALLIVLLTGLLEKRKLRLKI